MKSLSANSILSVKNLNAKSTRILVFKNINSLSSNSTLSVNNLNATSTSLSNKTNFSNLYVSGASTLLSTLIDNIIGSGTALTNLNYNAIWNQPALFSATTVSSVFYVSSNTLKLNNGIGAGSQWADGSSVVQ